MRRPPRRLSPLSSLVLLTACAAPAPLTVQTDAGVLEGVYADEEAGIRAFKGVPYARPPVGGDRWRPPSPVEPWNGVRAASGAGSPCWQTRGRAASLYSKGVTDPSEDCLYLNVWTPPADTGPSPVMVWFHGGGNTAGEGGSLIFDGTALARKGATVVTVNYRLGLFGFFAHPALTAESEHRSSGNYGLLDQIAALEWVQANIRAFGGDPSRVTIFGQSAGSNDVCRLMVSPLATGLFHRAIGQSGSCLGAPTYLERSSGGEGGASAHENGVRIAEAFGVEGTGAEAAERLRAIDAEELQTTRTGVGVGPIVDGWVTPDAPRTILEAGDFHHVPLMVGWMADETKGLRASLADVTADEYEPWVRDEFGASAEAVLEAYAPVAEESVTEALFRMTTDSGTGANARRWIRLVEGAGDAAYLYYFSHAAPVFRLYIPDDPHLDSPRGPRGMGAYHSGDLAYVFDNVGLVGVGWDEYDARVADIVSSYWVNFAATGDPNGEGLPEWPRYDGERDELMEFGRAVGAVADPRRDELDLFDRITGW